MVQILNPGSNRTVSERVRRKSEARRQDILRAAARVFRRSGVAAAGMRDIADEADLSPGNLYYYFAGIAVFLASSAADFVTGAAIAVDGGYSSLG